MTNEIGLEKLQRNDHDVLIRIETRMDSFITEMRQTNAASLATTSDHEARIRVLEVDRDRNTGNTMSSYRFKETVFTIIGILVAIATAYVTYMAYSHK